MFFTLIDRFFSVLFCTFVLVLVLTLTFGDPLVIAATAAIAAGRARIRRTGVCVRALVQVRRRVHVRVFLFVGSSARKTTGLQLRLLSCSSCLQVLLNQFVPVLEVKRVLLLLLHFCLLLVRLQQQLERRARLCILGTAHFATATATLMKRKGHKSR